MATVYRLAPLNTTTRYVWQQGDDPTCQHTDRVPLYWWTKDDYSDQVEIGEMCMDCNEHTFEERS